MQTSMEYDPLNRMIQNLADVGGINAKIENTYDAANRLVAVKDPNHLSTTYLYNGLGDLSSVTSPDTGVTSYLYDSAGNREWQTDARGVKSKMFYDVLNRLKKVEYTPAGTTTVNAGKTVQFYYDQSDSITSCVGNFALGRLTRFTDESGSTTLCYDRRANTVRKSQITNGVTFNLAMAYSVANHLISIIYPTGTTVVYGRDSQGRIASVSINRASFISSVTYLPFGPINQIIFAYGSATKTLTKSYDQNYDIDSIVSTAPGGLNMDYGVNEVGNISSIVQSTVAFNLGYDNQYRLTAVRDQNSALIEGFSYDATGNRISKQLGTNSPVIYSYAPSTHRLTDSGSRNRAFDANGNTQNISQIGSFVFDERNRFKKLFNGNTTRTSSYNALGERVLVSTTPGTDKSVVSSEKTFGTGYCLEGVYESASIFGDNALMLGDYHLCAQLDRDLVYLDSIPVAFVLNGAVNAIETDHLGTPRVVHDSTGAAAIWTWNTLSANPTGSNVFGEQTPTGKLNFPWRFPGQYSDSNGLNYNYFRDYELGTGRYVESDPIGIGGGVNSYLYANANSGRFVDPDGETAIAIGSAAAGTIGAGSAGAAAGGSSALLVVSTWGAGVTVAGAVGYGAGSLAYPWLEPLISPLVDKVCKGNDCLEQYVRCTNSTSMTYRVHGESLCQTCRRVCDAEGAWPAFVYGIIGKRTLCP